MEHSDALAALLAHVNADHRVCPLPLKWNELWELLPSRRRTASGGWEPPLPLILAAWGATSNAEKRARLDEHIHWAASHGSLDQVDHFIRALRQDDWLIEATTGHVGEYDD
jgi:hypothetical protein